MIELEDARDNIGALVVYQAHPAAHSEFGLIERVSETTIFVRFHLGDTAAGCSPQHLMLSVPARRPSDEEEVQRRVKEHNLKPVLEADTYNRLTAFLLAQNSRTALLLAGEITNQIGASRQREARR
jgi:hypothetical protein